MLRQHKDKSQHFQPKILTTACKIKLEEEGEEKGFDGKRKRKEKNAAFTRYWNYAKYKLLPWKLCTNGMSTCYFRNPFDAPEFG